MANNDQKNRPLSQPRPPEPKNRPLPGRPSMNPAGPKIRIK